MAGSQIRLVKCWAAKDTVHHWDKELRINLEDGNMFSKPINYLIGFMIFGIITIIIGSIIILIKLPSNLIGVLLLLVWTLLAIAVTIRFYNKRDVINNAIVQNNLSWLIWVSLIIIILPISLFIALLVIIIKL
jgi:hypothetical protein